MTLAERRLTFIRPDLSDAALADVSSRIAAAAVGPDRTGELPWEGLHIAHDAGLLTATVGTRHGGPGFGPAETTRILIALGEGDASVALLVANTLGIHASNANGPGWPEHLYRDFLRRSTEGPALSNAVRAEPELGAPARGGLPATVARRTPTGWVLEGRKAYATGGTGLAYHVVWAVVDEPGVAPAAPRVGHLIVPGHAAGITWIPTWDHLGLRASNTHDVIYDSVIVDDPEAFREIPRQGSGSYIDPANALVTTGFGHAALYVGVARAARTAFARFANERVPAALGRPIATTERIQAVAGEIEAQIATAEAILYAATARIAADDADVSAQSPVLKVQIVRAAVAAVQTAVAAIGNPGLSRHLPFERLLRDVLCARVHPPQEDAALLVVGRRVLAA